MTIGHRVFLVTFLVSFSGSISADADTIDDYLRSQMQRLHIPCASLAIVRDGRVIETQGYGFASLELKAPATTETVYEIGSN
ncbi:MAG: serine hydrolase, partial [Verrucomicrobia bacterium]